VSEITDNACGTAEDKASADGTEAGASSNVEVDATPEIGEAPLLRIRIKPVHQPNFSNAKVRLFEKRLETHGF
jgi:hypothetical protein